MSMNVTIMTKSKGFQKLLMFEMIYNAGKKIYPINARSFFYLFIYFI